MDVGGGGLCLTKVVVFHLPWVDVFLADVGGGCLCLTKVVVFHLSLSVEVGVELGVDGFRAIAIES